MLQNQPPCRLAMRFILVMVPPRNADVLLNASPWKNVLESARLLRR